MSKHSIHTCAPHKDNAGAYRLGKVTAFGVLCCSALLFGVVYHYNIYIWMHFILAVMLSIRASLPCADFSLKKIRKV